jgi:hypothetical protein
MHTHAFSMDTQHHHTITLHGDSHGAKPHVDDCNMRKFDWEDDVPVTNAKHVAPAHDAMGKHAEGGDLNTVKKAPTEDVNMRKFDWDDDVPVHSIRQEEDLPTLHIKHADTHVPVSLHGESNGQEASFSGLKKAPTDSWHMRKFDWEDDVPVHSTSSGHFAGNTLHAEAVPIVSRLAAVEESSKETPVVFNKFDCVVFKKDKKHGSCLANNGSFVVSIGSQMQLPAGWTLHPLGQKDVANAGFMPEVSVSGGCCGCFTHACRVSWLFCHVCMNVCMCTIQPYVHTYMTNAGLMPGVSVSGGCCRCFIHGCRVSWLFC